MENIVIPNIYPENDYNGDRLKYQQRKYISDLTSLRVGPVRLRQQRRRPMSCNRYGGLVNVNWTVKAPCDQTLSEGNYHAGNWYKPKHNISTKNMDILSLAYIYHSETELRGVGYTGIHKKYSGAGYPAVLGVNALTAQQIIAQLKQDNWIDTYTNVVFLEFTLYNAPHNQFLTAVIAFEFGDTAGSSMISSSLFQAYDAFSRVKTAWRFITISIYVVHYVIFVACYLFQIVVYREKFFRKMLKNGWICFDMVELVTDSFVIGFYRAFLQLNETEFILLSFPLTSTKNTWVDLSTTTHFGEMPCMSTEKHFFKKHLTNIRQTVVGNLWILDMLQRARNGLANVLASRYQGRNKNVNSFTGFCKY